MEVLGYCYVGLSYHGPAFRCPNWLCLTKHNFLEHLNWFFHFHGKTHLAEPPRQVTQPVCIRLLNYKHTVITIIGEPPFKFLVLTITVH